MLFGTAGATVAGKSLEGYANGREEPGRPRPMAHFVLDEPAQDGATSLTLEITQAQYQAILPGQTGTVSWWGERLSDFVPQPEAGAPDFAPDIVLPEEPVVVPVELPLAEELPSAEELPPVEEPSPVEEIPPAEIAPPVEEPSYVETPPTEKTPAPSGPGLAEHLLPALDALKAQLPKLASALNLKPTASDAAEKPTPPLVCPWCGREMGRWRMHSRDSFTMKEGLGWTWSMESVKKLFLSEHVDKSVELAGTHLLLWVCEDCKKAVIDYKGSACDGNF